jgi:hypothetical protein
MGLSRRGIILTSSLIVISGAGILLNQWINSPASTSSGYMPEAEVLSSSTKLQPFETTYFSTLVPDTFQLKVKEENSKAVNLGNYLFTSKDVTKSRQLAITIGATGRESISNVSHVIVRKNSPQEYNPVIIKNMPEGAVAFKKPDGSETSVFWLEDSRYVAVVITGSTVDASLLDQSLQAVLINWR